MKFQPLFGFLVFIGIAWLASENRRRIHWKLIAIGVVIQLSLGLLFFKIPLFQATISKLNGIVLALEQSTRAGTSMVFGYLGGSTLPFEESFPGASFILAFNALPMILVISALSSLFFYWRVLPVIIQIFSFILEKTLKIGGAEGLGLAANIFVGMVESPLLIRPYIQKLTRSELFSILSCGMATVAGTVIVLYASILSSVASDALGHILIASVISIPAAYVISKIIVPETNTITEASLQRDPRISSAFQAITEGTIQGVKLLVNVTAMLIVMVALVELINIAFSLLPEINGQTLTLQGIFGILFSPVAWLIGIPWEETHTAGSLLGTKTVINELVAYLALANLPEGALNHTSTTVLIYSMCGFANPGSLGIMIGGLTAIAPDRKQEVIELSVKSMLSGTLAALMTGSVASMFLSIS